MKTLAFSYRRALLWVFVLTVIGSVGVALAGARGGFSSVLVFAGVFAVLTLALFRTLSPIRISYSEDEVVFRQIASGDCRVKWAELDRVDRRKGNQHVFRFGPHSLYLLPHCYEDAAWQDFVQNIKIKKWE